jgi:spore coat protein U-like protein
MSAPFSGRWKRTIAAVCLYAANPAAMAAECSVNAAGLVFGVYEPLQSAPLDSAGSVGVSCWWTNPPGYSPQNLTVTVGLGTGSSGTYASRSLRAGPNALQYNLYRDIVRSQVWGNGSGGTTLQSASIAVHRHGPAVSQAVTVYGRIFAQQDAAAGSYVDTITVTVEW